MKYSIFGAAAMLLLLAATACAGKNNIKSTSGAEKDSNVAEFPLPQIPDSLRVPEARLSYLMRHYWSAVDWKSSQAQTDTAMMEQGMVNFLELMQHADSTTAADGYRAFLRSVPREGRHMGEHLIQLTSDYLFTPDSPVYSPQTYACAIDALLAEHIPGEAQAARYQAQHEELMKNRPGTVATDFEIETRYGGKTSLKALTRDFAATAPER